MWAFNKNLVYEFMVVYVAFVVLFYGFELLRCLYTNKESNIALVCLDNLKFQTPIEKT